MPSKSGFVQELERLPLPMQVSNRGYPPIQLFVQFMAGVWCGANRFFHLDVSRFDRNIQKIFGWDRMSEHKAFQRYFEKFDMASNYNVFGGLYRWFFDNLKFDNFTLDIDFSVITRYGEQQGAKKGYNKHKPGRKSQHPIIAFVSDVEMVANFWLRSGDAHTANNFKAFLEETLSFFGNKKIGLLRLDSGFYDQSIFDYLEQEEVRIDYITAVPMYVTIQRKIALENRIKELKYDYGLDKMNQDGFDGTEACLLLMTIAYNFMSLFKQFVINEKVRNRLSTLRYKMLAIPAYIEEYSNKTIVKMALQMNRRTWIRKLWDKSAAFQFY